MPIESIPGSPILSPPGPVHTQVNPHSMSIVEMARMLSAAGGKRVTTEEVQADIDEGAPVGTGGRLNLVQYTAWLLRKVQSGDEKK